MGMHLIFCRLAALCCVLFLASPLLAGKDDLREAVQAASVKAGQRLALRCKACHTLKQGGPNKLGPNLWNIVGRVKGGAEGFKYSKAFEKLDGQWTLVALDKFLTDPRKYAPGNRMKFPGLHKQSQRYAILAYLTTLGGQRATGSAQLPEHERSDDTPMGSGLADELGLPQGAGREEVAALCSACHSLKIVQQQGLDADRWNGLMDWMTEKQGMPALAGDDRTKIVSYLAEHYGPQSRLRGTSSINPMMPRMPAMPSQQK